jgi:hypothetical protein
MRNWKLILERRNRMIFIIENIYETDYEKEGEPTWKFVKSFCTIVNKMPSLKTILSFDRIIQKEMIYVGF